jgi:phage-related holin
VAYVFRLVKDVFSYQSLTSSTRGVAALLGVIIAPVLQKFMHDGRGWWWLLLVAVIIGDWISGTAASKKDGTYGSAYGIAGIARTALLVWLPLIGLLADYAFSSLTTIDNPGYLYYAITTGLVYHSWESMTANAVRAGWSRWIPDSVILWVTSEIQAKTNRAQSRDPNNQPPAST